jgi:hypothetical protein
MYASTAVNNASAGIPQEYVNQAYILMFVVIKFLLLIFPSCYLSSLIEMVDSADRSFPFIYEFT